jgi:hypothetical protein
MTRYEYKVVPAPVQGRKARGVKGTAERFALALETLMNEMGQDGWDYVRADTLPCEERTGLTGRTTTFQNMLVFRRQVAGEAAEGPEVAGLLSAPLPEGATDAAEGADAAAARAPEGRADAKESAARKEPPFTRFTPKGGAAEGRPEAGAQDASEAARAAAAALRTYRAAVAPDRDGPGEASRSGGGLAAE